MKNDNKLSWGILSVGICMLIMLTIISWFFLFPIHFNDISTVENHILKEIEEYVAAGLKVYHFQRSKVYHPM